MQKTVRLTQPTKEPAYVRNNEGLPIRPGQKPADRFVYVHYPKRWDFHMDHGFLPVPSKIPARPGCNGISRNRDLSPALVVHQQQGATFIDPTDRRLGDFQDYVQFYTCENGQKWWVDSCMTATVLPGRQIVWSSKPGAWDGFRMQIRDSDMVEPLLPEVLDLMLAKQRKTIERLAGRAGTNPILQERLKNEEAKLDAMLATWDEMTGKKLAAVKAKPRKSRGVQKQKSINIVKGAE